MPKILLVDVDTGTLNAFAEQFKAQSGDYKMLTAGSCKEVPGLVDKSKINMVLIDLKMPEADDIEFLFKMSKDYPKVSIVVMTAFGTPEIEKKINKFETCSYYEKPIDIPSLTEKIVNDLESVVGGKIHGIALSSFLQMSEMEKTTCKLTVTADEKVGLIYLQKGALISAQVGSLKGNTAAFEILSWDDAAIEIEKIDLKKKKEISMPLMNILMEGLRIKDEKVAAEKQKRQTDSPRAGAGTAKPGKESGDEPGDEKDEPLEMLSLDEEEEGKKDGTEQKGDTDREPSKAPDAATPKKKKKRASGSIREKKNLKRVSQLVILMVIFTAGGIGWFKVIRPLLAAKAYREVLKQVDDQATLEEKEIVLQNYIESHPPGPHTTDADKKIKEIFDLIQKREFDSIIVQVRSLGVDKNYKTQATALYTVFLNQFPDGIYADRIRRKMLEIPAIIDENDYAELKAIDAHDYDKRIVAYQAYLQEHLEGRYREDVEALLSDMCEIYYRYLKKEVKACDRKKDWERCIWLCDKFVASYENNSLSGEVKKLRDAMQAKKTMAELKAEEARAGSDYEAARNIYLDFLKENPGSPAKQKIKVALTALNKKIREKKAWDEIVYYSQRKKINVFDRVETLEDYINKKAPQRYQKRAGVLMKQLQKEKKKVIRRQKMEAEQRRKEAERQAEIRRKRERIKKEKLKAGAEVGKLGRRYVVKNNGTVEDRQTGLMWAILDTHVELRECLDYDEPNEYIKNFEEGGYTDWRLPTANDLLVILNNKPHFPLSGAKWYWTSEAYWKGYHEFVKIVTFKKKGFWSKEEADMEKCGAARAVRP